MLHIESIHFIFILPILNWSLTDGNRRGGTKCKIKIEFELLGLGVRSKFFQLLGYDKMVK